MKYPRNSDPNYFHDNQGKSNCGSFAFNVQGWYRPDDYVAEQLGRFYIDEIEDGFLELYANGYGEDELTDLYVYWVASEVLNDFGDEVRLLDEENLNVRAGEELVELRTFVWIGDDSWCEYDFHFKVLRDGIWMEKTGTQPVKFCEEDEWGQYVSRTIYFAHKIAQEDRWIKFVGLVNIIGKQH